jgi:putative colanic acid biosynthesis acetyltransferase WcaF
MNRPRQLSGFTGAGYSIGRSKLVQILWLATQSLVIQHWWCPAVVRTALLRAFGANIGRGALIRHRVRIHWPWRLTIGDSSWVGEGAWILNLEHVTIGRDTVISQDVLLCTGSHDADSPTFEFDNGPINIGNEAWVATRAIILRGVTIGDGAVVAAGTVVRKNVDPGTRVYGRN